ncbi:MAG: hypothetical protein KDC45_08785, partial [Bacteroidetes bacterium]|nr:hypothetical protein [Bacteroidota bacterium]
DRAKTMVNFLLSHLNQGDEVALIRTTAVSENNTFKQSFGEAGRWIRDLTFSHSKPSPENAVYKAVELMKSARNPNKEIYLVSAFQDAVYPDEKIRIPDDIHLLLIDLLKPPMRNVAAIHAEVTSRLFETGKPVELKLVLRNDGIDKTAVQASVFLNQRRVAQVPISLEGEGMSESIVRFIVPNAGYLKGRVEIDEDALLADNTRYFHLFVEDSIRVQLVGDESDTRLIDLALNPTGSSDSRIKTTRISAEKVGLADFSSAEIIVLSNMPLSESLVRKLRRALDNGKGLILFPGDKIDFNQYNRLLGDWKAGTWLPLRDVGTSKDVFVGFGETDMLHPIINGLFDVTGVKKKLESPAIFRMSEIKPGPNAKLIIALSSGGGFLAESPVGDGHLMMFAVAPQLAWSDFPIRGLFAPLIVRSVYYLASTQSLAESDRAPAITVASRDVSGLPSLRSSKGEIIVPTSRTVDAKLILSIPESATPDNYEILDGERIIGIADVNPNPDYTNPAKAPIEKLQSIFALENLEIIKENDRMEDYILRSRYGGELWNWFLIVALALLFMELVISQWDTLRGASTKTAVRG